MISDLPKTSILPLVKGEDIGSLRQDLFSLSPDQAAHVIHAVLPNARRRINLEQPTKWSSSDETQVYEGLSLPVETVKIAENMLAHVLWFEPTTQHLLQSTTTGKAARQDPHRDETYLRDLFWLVSHAATPNVTVNIDIHNAQTAQTFMEDKSHEIMNRYSETQTESSAKRDSDDLSYFVEALSYSLDMLERFIQAIPSSYWSPGRIKDRKSIYDAEITKAGEVWKFLKTTESNMLPFAQKYLDHFTQLRPTTQSFFNVL